MPYKCLLFHLPYQMLGLYYCLDQKSGIEIMCFAACGEPSGCNFSYISAFATWRAGWCRGGHVKLASEIYFDRHLLSTQNGRLYVCSIVVCRACQNKGWQQTWQNPGEGPLRSCLQHIMRLETKFEFRHLHADSRTCLRVLTADVSSFLLLMFQVFKHALDLIASMPHTEQFRTLTVCINLTQKSFIW